MSDEMFCLKKAHIQIEGPSSLNSTDHNLGPTDIIAKKRQSNVQDIKVQVQHALLNFSCLVAPKKVCVSHHTQLFF
jgi:hypothetical protein